MLSFGEGTAGVSAGEWPRSHCGSFGTLKGTGIPGFLSWCPNAGILLDAIPPHPRSPSGTSISRRLPCSSRM